jgi:long-chain fatty acid transport protein
VVREKCMRALGGGLLALALLASGRLDASGFALFEQGAKATALGGAFVAEADDPSAMFFNPAGNAFNEKLTLSGGVFLVMRPSAHFEGGNPYPGGGYTTNMEKPLYYMGNGYMVVPIKPGVFNVSAGFWSPAGLGIPWAYPDQYAGRFISQRVDIRQVAASVQFAVKLADWIAIGAGPEMRFSDVKLSRNVGLFNPFNDRFTDVAHISLMSKGTPVEWTWNAGIMLKPCDRLRLGVAYHGEVTFNYSGEAEFGQISTGNAQLDALVKTRLPVGQTVPGGTSIGFPSLLIFGASYDLTPKLKVNVDANYVGWDVFKETVLTIQGLPSTTIPHDFVNTWTIRGGLGYQASESLWLGGGVLYDQSGQPDFDVGPLLPDANRTGVSVGVGINLGKHTRIDISSLFLWFHERTTTTNESGFNGTYKTFAILPGLSATMSF